MIKPTAEILSIGFAIAAFIFIGCNGETHEEQLMLEAFNPLDFGHKEVVALSRGELSDFLYGRSKNNVIYYAGVAGERAGDIDTVEK